MDDATWLLYNVLKALLRKQYGSALNHLSILKSSVERGYYPDVPAALFELQKEPIPGVKPLR